MATGTVELSDPIEGFGCVQPDAGGSDVFVHIGAVQRAGPHDMREDRTISYGLAADQRSGEMSADQIEAM